MKRTWILTVVLVSGFIVSSASGGETVKIVTWNGEALFDPAAVDARSDDLAEFAQKVKPDVLLLCEVGSLAAAKAVRDRMGLEGYHVACSDFNPDGNQYSSLEVAVISKFSLAGVVEYDRQTDERGPAGAGSERKLERVDVPGIAEISVGRGFLYADLKDMNLGVVVTHLKSSRGRTGESDKQNARKRELVAAAIVSDVTTRCGADPNLTVIVAGDINVGETDIEKNGRDLEDDDTDGYDDTHAIMTSGLTGGVRMVSLTRDLGFETYVGDIYPGTGPIDCMYTAGLGCRNFTLASTTKDSFGSDHRAVITHRVALDLPDIVRLPIPVSGGATPPELNPLPPAIGRSIRISKLLPNPAGGVAEEARDEAVWIANGGDVVVNLTGWKLRDARGDVWLLSGTVDPGTERKVIRNGMQMSMGNSGDTIDLVDLDGRVVDRVRYGRAGQDEVVERD